MLKDIVLGFEMKTKWVVREPIIGSFFFVKKDRVFETLKEALHFLETKKACLFAMHEEGYCYTNGNNDYVLRKVES